MSVSDRRVKEDILHYKPVLDGIKKIQVSSYYLRHVGKTKKELGLIAQDAAQYFPEIVSEIQDKNGQTLLGVAYGKTGVLAIKAIQEQQELIEQMQVKIEQLEKKLEALTTK